MALPTDPKARKRIPIASGVVRYFPDALIAVAEVSYLGNEQHNPGEPLHWSREKSNDHEDCLMRHIVDKDWAKAAWRALAILQLAEEQKHRTSNEATPYHIVKHSMPAGSYG